MLKFLQTLFGRAPDAPVSAPLAETLVPEPVRVTGPTEADAAAASAFLADLAATSRSGSKTFGAITAGRVVEHHPNLSQVRKTKPKLAPIIAGGDYSGLAILKYME